MGEIILLAWVGGFTDVCCSCTPGTGAGGSGLFESGIGGVDFLGEAWPEVFVIVDCMKGISHQCSHKCQAGIDVNRIPHTLI